jgi:NAD(P)-dependent dehydrogenase (short-subunit alcohol dehydrogenase family)
MPRDGYGSFQGGKMSTIWSAARAFQGKVAIVTGAGRAMGREISLTVAGGGAIVGVIERDRETAAQTAALIHDMGGEALDVTRDVASAAAVNQAVRSVMERFGTVDILVNNAEMGTTRRRVGTVQDIASHIFSGRPYERVPCGGRLRAGTRAAHQPVFA